MQWQGKGMGETHLAALMPVTCCRPITARTLCWDRTGPARLRRPHGGKAGDLQWRSSAMGQRGHGGTSGYKTRVQSGGTHVPLTCTLATGTLPFLGGSSLSCPSFPFCFLSFLPFYSGAGSGSFGFFFGAGTDCSACTVSQSVEKAIGGGVAMAPGCT